MKPNNTPVNRVNEVLTVPVSFTRGQARELIELMTWDKLKGRYYAPPFTLDELRVNFYRNLTNRPAFWAVGNSEPFECIDTAKHAAFFGALTWLLAGDFMTVDASDEGCEEFTLTAWESDGNDGMKESGPNESTDAPRSTITRAQCLLLGDDVPELQLTESARRRSFFSWPVNHYAEAANDENEPAEAKAAV